MNLEKMEIDIIKESMIGMKTPGEVEKEFWTKVDRKEDWECWRWKPATCDFDYGSFRGEVATRMAYKIFHQRDISEDLFVCHRCDFPSCCNPLHLFLGTHEDNMRDMVEKGRQNTKPVLNSYQIIAIRKAMHKIKTSKLSKLFGVSPSMISKIWNSDSYKCKEGFKVEFFLTYNRNPFTGEQLYQDWRPK